MKKKELVDLIRETLYSELPEIISEIKSEIRNEMLSEAPVQDGQAIREHIRQVHKRHAGPPGAQKIVDYKGEAISSGQGVLDWFKDKVKDGATAPAKHYTDNQMTEYMSKKFGTKIS